MNLEESLYCIRVEFLKELDKRKELLDKIAELQAEIEQLNRDLKAYRTFYPMKNEVCGNVCLPMSASMKIELRVNHSALLFVLH